MLVHLAVGCAVAIAVFKLVTRVPWPGRMNWRFIALHVVAAPLSTATWIFVSLLFERVVGGSSDITVAERTKELLVIGTLFYTVIAGLAYSSHGAQRAAQAEAVAAQTQLATLRSQLQPHFLFNSLHTIVQLINIEPRKASDAAEIVAELLRRSLEEQRDEVPLRDEWRFVSRYLAIEQLRFGERLVISTNLPQELENELVPSFALQTLVENAVQHGAAPRVAPTEIVIDASRTGRTLTVSVRNSGDSQSATTAVPGTGTGLARLRERLSVMYNQEGTLSAAPLVSGGYEAVLTVPRKPNALA